MYDLMISCTYTPTLQYSLKEEKLQIYFLTTLTFEKMNSNTDNAIKKPIYVRVTVISENVEDEREHNLFSKTHDLVFQVPTPLKK